jgi:hypothetical protein
VIELFNDIADQTALLALEAARAGDADTVLVSQTLVTPLPAEPARRAGPTSPASGEVTL